MSGDNKVGPNKAVASAYRSFEDSKASETVKQFVEDPNVIIARVETYEAIHLSNDGGYSIPEHLALMATRHVEDEGEATVSAFVDGYKLVATFSSTPAVKD